MKQTHVNRCVLKPQKGDVIEIVPLGDLHKGSPTFNEKKAIETRDYCVKNNIYVIGMGDYIECGTKTSVGDGVYSQTSDPQTQLEWMIEFFRPLSDKGLLLGLHTGNHCLRVRKESGIDVVATMCMILKVPYLGYTCYHHIRVGKQGYTVWSTHGYSSARLPHTKLNAAIKASSHATVDLVLYAHTHGLEATASLNEKIDGRNRTITTNGKHIVLTGSFLEYRGSYAEMLGLPPVKTGVAKIMLRSDRHDVHVSV